MAGFEAEFFVEGDCRGIVRANFEKDWTGAAAAEFFDHMLQKFWAEAPASGVGVNRYGIDASPGSLAFEPHEARGPAEKRMASLGGLRGGDEHAPVLRAGGAP